MKCEGKAFFCILTSYRNRDAVAVMSIFNTSRRSRFGYSSDFLISKLKSDRSAGHVLILGILLMWIFYFILIYFFSFNYY